MDNQTTVLASEVIELQEPIVEILSNTFKLKRGLSVHWIEQNPLLEQGEPGFAYDTNELKIGDGLHSWNDLPLLTGETIESSNSLTIVATLPEVGQEDLIYKVNETQKLYIWNGLTNLYEEIAIGTESGEEAGGIIVVENFESLPEIGANDSLYKIHSTQKIYTWNSLLNMYQELGQGSGSVTPQEGYTITLQNATDSRIFVALEGDPVTIAFRYASVDADGLNDGAGIGTLIVN